MLFDSCERCQCGPGGEYEWIFLLSKRLILLSVGGGDYHENL